MTIALESIPKPRQEYISRLVRMDDSLAAKINVLRYGECSDGFQRKLVPGRIKRMAASFVNGNICPPIFVAECDGRFVLIDGQHRLEAWKQAKFTLFLQITRMTMDDALKNFLIINSTSVRVPFALRLQIDTGEYALRLRQLADKYKLDIKTAHSFVIGIASETAYYRNDIGDVQKVFSKADIFISHWIRDRRWKMHLGVFSCMSVLRSIGTILRNSHDPAGVIAELLKMDYNKNGPIALRIASGTNSSIKRVGDYAYKFLAKQII